MHTLASLASREMVTLQSGALLADAVVLMTEKNISSILVTQGSAIVGIITERDLIRFMCSGIEPTKTSLESVMAKRLVHLPETALLDEALFVMEKEGVRHLLIIEARDETLKPKGLITYTDIVRKLGEEFFNTPRTVQECMSKDLYRVEADTPINSAIELMNAQGISCLLIERHGKTVGILTERDVVRLIRNNYPINNSVSKIMSPSPMSVTHEVSLFEAARVMEHHRIRRLLVRNEEGQIFGLLTNTDIVRAVRESFRSVLEGEVVRARKVLAMIGDGVAEVDGSSCRILWINPSGAPMLGLSGAEEALGRDFPSLIEPRWGEILREHFIDHIPGKAMTCETALPVGARRHLLMSYHMYRDFRGEPRIRVVYSDITALAEAKAKLKEEKERLRTIFDSSREGMMILDAGGQIIQYNARALEILRLPQTKNGIVSLHEWNKYVDFKDENGRAFSSGSIPIYSAISSEKTTHDQVIRVTFRASGRSIWLMASAIPIAGGRYAIVTFYDVTAQKQKEMEILRSEKKFRTLFQNLNEAVILLSPSGEVIDLNPSALRVLGVAEGLPLPLPLANFGCDFLDKDGNPIPIEEAALCDVYNRKKMLKGQVVGIRNGREVHWGILNQTPTLAEDGSVESIIATFSDLTEYMESKRQEEVLLACSLDLTRAMTEGEVYSILEHYLRRLRRGGPKIDAILLHTVNANQQSSPLAIRWVEPGITLNEEFRLDRCKAFASGVDVVVKDAAIEYGCPYSAICATQGSYFCTNISVGGQVVGVLQLYSLTPGFFDDHTVRLVHGLLALAAPTISNMRLIEHNRQLSLIDPLTGLHNRRYLKIALEKILTQVSQTSQPLCLIMADIDQFKNFNDTYGHEAGDKVLQMVAANLKSCLREGDIAVRFGGEEITIVLVGAEKESGMSIAERIRQRIENTRIDVDNGHKYITVSLGLAAFPEHGDTLEKLIRHADLALYEAKRLGKNRVAGFHEAAGLA